MADIHPLNFPGDYALDEIKIVNSVGESLGLRMGQVQELNVYEDINSSSLTGSIAIADAHNIISNAALQGNERLIFKLYTPGNEQYNKKMFVDATEETGHPFHIYALSDRKNLTETTMSYILHFCSRELFRNARTRVSKAYNGGFAESVISILRDREGIDTRKHIFFEKTRNQDKIVIPNIRPFDAVNMMASRALSKNGNGAGYYFYETTKGFHFRSYENMLANKTLYPRDEAVTLHYTPKKIHNNTYMNEHGIDSYEFMQHFDTLSQQAMGTYASRVITHNIYDKSYNIKDYNYHNYFAGMYHTDQIGNASKRNYHISNSPVDDELREYPAKGHKTASDYPNSKVILQGTTRFLHGENTGIFGTSPDNEGLTEAIRQSQENQVENSTRIKVVMKGHSYLQAGDIVNFRLPSMEPDKGEMNRYGYDEFHSGRYLITKLRHRVIRSEYKMVLELVKDSTYNKYPDAEDDYFKVNESYKGSSQDIYDLDEFDIGETASPGHPSNR